MEKNKVSVKINGTDYTLVTVEPPEYVQKVAILVDKKLKEITENCPHLSTAMSAMLTAINLADDNLKNTEASDNLRNELADYSKAAEAAEEKLKAAEERTRLLEKENQSLKIVLAKYEGAKNAGRQGGR